MTTELRRGFVLCLVALAIFGLAYPLAGTGLAQLLFPTQANGSIGKYGSTLIGQQWSGPKWFHGRPDSDNPLKANGRPGTSGAANLGPRSKVLVSETSKLIRYWRRQGVTPTSDLVTTSGSGLDPDITPSDAIAQIPMVSSATGIAPQRLRQLIRAQTVEPELGFLGPAYVDVLKLNLALARLR
ncbi:MAG: potassium-transporting ATPase subunit C [Candidatus Dormibacteria bacterium]|jgi:K+-transporting ATPase ATPase C chain